MRAYYTAATLARLGDEMVGTALAVYLLTRGIDPALTGITLSAYALPSMLTGPLLGSWLDGTRYRRAALASNQFALAAAMVGIVVTPGWAAPPLAALAGLALPMTSAGFSAMVPGLAGPARLTRANSLDSLSFSAAAMAGPAVAGLLAKLITPTGSVLAIAAAAIGSVVALAFIAPVPPSPHGRQPVLTGLRHMVRTPKLRAVTLATVLGWGAMGLLIVPLTERTDQLGVGEDSSGFVLTAVEIGCVITNVALIRLQGRWWTVLVSLAGYGVALSTWSLAGTFPVLLALALVAGLALGPQFPALLAARQRYSPPELLSQVGATGASLKIGAYALGAALVGPLRTVLSPVGVIAVVGVMQVVAAALGWVVSRPSRRAPEPGAVATADRRRSA
ncbi:MFS transporter [Kutzneria kofuensis]|uniref:Putative MFS family arabinose efflux permease n=1 Tax=Kutzneria kofuensis TaxID=103725 RepID=A0A7W9NI18_9PSEU|nr:MFS transporter [Kutzneria kofuensis]MBB5894097.1 putative MFS family arabinose efflux permease [Kutzneria kofuensis]